MYIILSIGLFLIAYLLGSIPTAVWVSKSGYGSDVRTYGSGNAGSTNMFRVFGVKAGIITQLVDIAKGALAASLPFFLGLATVEPHVLSDLSPILQSLICGLTAVIGHIYPILAGFKGGKGINTLLGTILVASPAAGGICLLVFILVVLLTRYVSLGSMLGTLSFSVYILVRWALTGNQPETLLIVLSFSMFLLVVFTHRANIGRLLQGNENRANIFKKKG